jgi:hypothetical protein
MKVIPETWRIWWRSFQKRDVSDEGYSRNVTYLMKVIPETWRSWWRSFQKRDVSDEGYSRNVTYLMKVFLNNLHQMRHVPRITFIRYVTFLEKPSSDTSRFWNNLHQIRHVSGITFIRYVTFLDVSDEGYSRNVTYLMKVFLETWRIWWRLF